MDLEILFQNLAREQAGLNRDELSREGVFGNLREAPLVEDQVVEEVKGFFVLHELRPEKELLVPDLQSHRNHFEVVEPRRAVSEEIEVFVGLYHRVLLAVEVLHGADRRLLAHPRFLPAVLVQPELDGVEPGDFGCHLLHLALPKGGTEMRLLFDADRAAAALGFHLAAQEDAYELLPVSFGYLPLLDLVPGAVVFQTGGLISDAGSYQAVGDGQVGLGL